MFGIRNELVKYSITYLVVFGLFYMIGSLLDTLILNTPPGKSSILDGFDFFIFLMITHITTYLIFDKIHIKNK
jgi:hypothetical protein